MKRILILIMAASFLAMFSTVAFAGTDTPCDRYYSDPDPAGNANPHWETDHWVWDNPPWAHGPLPAGDFGVTTPLPASSVMYFGHENLSLENLSKRVYLIITYTGGKLELDGIGVGYKVAGKRAGDQNAETVASTDDVLYIRLLIVPQPDWEWIRIKNTGGTAAAISNVKFYTKCDPIPSLTEWGMIGLVVLMLAAGAMVIVRRRRATAAA